MRPVFTLILLWLICFAPKAYAHEIKPGYLEIKQSVASSASNDVFVYTVIWKAPIRLGRPLAVTPEFPDNCQNTIDAKPKYEALSVVTRSALSCETPLQGSQLMLNGLDATLTDVLIRFEQLSGEQQTLRATADHPVVTIATVPSSWAVAKTFFVLGVEHIWFGFDHLLFVLGLVLLISGTRRIIETITAFTIAHSVTLIATTLGWVSVSIRPVEAVIALSIIFLATEIAKKTPGQTRFTERNPWIVASTFGLLHGFGFASALSNIGMPDQDIPIALLTFNLGVEFGQLAFVAALLIILHLLTRISMRQKSELLASYLIGSLSVFWLLERVI